LPYSACLSKARERPDDYLDPRGRRGEEPMPVRWKRSGSAKGIERRLSMQPAYKIEVPLFRPIRKKRGIFPSSGNQDLRNFIGKTPSSRGGRRKGFIGPGERNWLRPTIGRRGWGEPRQHRKNPCFGEGTVFSKKGRPRGGHSGGAKKQHPDWEEPRTDCFYGNKGGNIPSQASREKEWALGMS